MGDLTHPQKLAGLAQDTLGAATDGDWGAAREVAAVPPDTLGGPGERADNYPVLVLVDWVSATAT